MSSSWVSTIPLKVILAIRSVRRREPAPTHFLSIRRCPCASHSNSNFRDAFATEWNGPSADVKTFIYLSSCRKLGAVHL